MSHERLRPRLRTPSAERVRRSKPRVITEIDVRKALKAKINVDFGRYLILERSTLKLTHIHHGGSSWRILLA